MPVGMFVFFSFSFCLFFIKQGPSELNVKEGDIVELVNENGRDNFITVKLQNRQVGVIPVQCAQTYRIKESTFL